MQLAPPPERTRPHARIILSSTRYRRPHATNGLVRLARADKAGARWATAWACPRKSRSHLIAIVRIASALPGVWPNRSMRPADRSTLTHRFLLSAGSRVKVLDGYSTNRTANRRPLSRVGPASARGRHQSTTREEQHAILCEKRPNFASSLGFQTRKEIVTRE